MGGRQRAVGSDNHMKAKFAMLIKGGQLIQERAYELASQAVGRALVPGFGLTTCTHGELIRILDAVSGKIPHSTFRIPHSRAPRRADPPNVIRVASVEQFQLARALEAELHIGMDEARGIAMQAGVGPHPRTAMQVAKYTEALKAIARRRRSAAAQPSRPDQRAANE
jgi:hypothetical protein